MMYGAMFECAEALPARISTATQIASINSCCVAPWRRARSVWPRMQYGHCVAWATATAMSSLVFCGRAPSAKTCSPTAVTAAAAPGANSLRFALTAREGAGYIDFSLIVSYIWRAEERRVGKECVMTFRYQGCPD